jgi:hypothetical protein
LNIFAVVHGNKDSCSEEREIAAPILKL